MLSIMTQILNEKVTQPLVDVILRNLVKDDKVHYLFIYFSYYWLKGCFSKAYGLDKYTHVVTCITHSSVQVDYQLMFNFFFFFACAGSIPQASF